ncbi:calcium-binding protein [Aestuariicoccus sp. MJ-SS9]|uniref:calcium-binding protein n=1 Tax=Aestuariicoccus sp. MJ-SS9 TaxID=3079855 RepID=UPI00290C4A2F|nr:calcium-binding protein [Aestuariicoccus sp. MJ-SS9]MDU8913562.1 calcium-binding protein [Aestuariicoccus sp. MJ-SS9]
MATASASTSDFPIIISDLDLNFHFENYLSFEFFDNTFSEDNFGEIHEDFLVFYSFDGTDYYALYFWGEGIEVDGAGSITGGIVSALGESLYLGESVDDGVEENVLYSIGEVSLSAVAIYEASLTDSSEDELALLEQAFSGADTVVLSDYSDSFSAFDGNDTLRGEGGDDTLLGGSGDDSIIGGDGNDVLDGGTENDSIFGIDGDDTLSGAAGDDNIGAGAGNDEVIGGGGNDLMGGGPGNDFMEGGTGNDFMGGGQDDDTVDGGDGNDVVNGGPGNDSMIGGEGSDTMGGSFGADRIEGGDGNDDLGGGSGQDVISAGAGDDSVGGGEANDVIFGDGGNDFLAGGGRDDDVDGGTGNDTINGGDGDDTMTGGDGADVFVWNVFKAGDADVITDFEDGVDSFRMVAVENAPGSGLAGKVAALNITDTAAGALIDYQGHTVLIEGVAAADLTVDDFTFL